MADQDNKKQITSLEKRQEKLEEKLSQKAGVGVEGKLKELADKQSGASKEAARRDKAVDAHFNKVDNTLEKHNEKITEIGKIARATSKKLTLLAPKFAEVNKQVKKLEKGNEKAKDDIKNIKSSLVQQAKASAANKNDKTIASLASSLNAVATSLQRINGIIAKSVKGVQGPAAMGAVPEPPPAVTGVKKDAGNQGGIMGMIGSLLTNPAVIAAIAGIVYTVLPKEYQDKIKAFLGGFASGLEEGMGKNENEGLSGFNTALKAAGIALSVYFGAKLISGIASAITTTLNILKVLGGGKIGRGLAVVGVAAVGAVAVSKLGGKEEEAKPEEGGAPKPSGTPSSAPAPETPAGKESPSGTPPAVGKGPVENKGTTSAGGYVSPAAGRVSSPFGMRTHPITKQQSMHPGVDIAAPSGTPVVATKSGTVLSANYGENGGYGNLIQIDHGNGEVSKYAHLSAISTAPGSKVEAGQEIGKVGSTGRSTGPHLHFEIKKSGQPADPASLITSLGSPLPANSKVAQTNTDAPRPVTDTKPAASAITPSASNPVASSVTPSATPMAKDPTTGQLINSASQDIKNGGTKTGGSTNVSNVNNNNQGSKKREEDDNSIPSPIASRGVLQAFTKHLTAAHAS
jgi:murein DD-endopeptidase MepM/ murein hydrolase activator NlpD